jgi:hypothetical protein
MSRRHSRSSHHKSPHELRLWAIVDSVVADVSEKKAYLAFAHELMEAERRSGQQEKLEFRDQNADG